MIEIKLSYAKDRATAVADCRFWAPLALPAEAKQGVEDPRELARLADELDDEQAASRFICTADPEEVVERIAPYLELGFRHLVFHSPAHDQLGFLERFAAEIARCACARSDSEDGALHIKGSDPFICGELSCVASREPGVPDDRG